MPNLSDTQALLLSHASRREDCALYPLPETLRPGGGTAKAVAALIARGLAEEREITDRKVAHRVDGDVAYGLFVTPAGLAAIGVESDGGVGNAAGESDGHPAGQGSGPAQADSATASTEPGSTSADGAAAPARQTKSGLVLSLLARDGGATLSELIEATGWLPHTTRAALTGVRKKGHAVERSKRGEETCYRITGATPSTGSGQAL